MEYKELSHLFHTDASSSRHANLDSEYHARFDAESTFHTGFVTPNGELFFTVPRELSVLNERVLRTERKISNLLRRLPGIAGHAMLMSMVLEEVVCTNTIENIHSTRRQIKDAIDAAEGNSLESRRFKEIATLYQSIVYGTSKIPNTPEDIRMIYDEVTAREIPKDKLPDGKLFRKEGVDITAGGVRVIHRGIEPEGKIIEAMENMISLSQDDSVPAIYSAIASHYLFEYAHPFYDGNGRTGRYLLSLLLSEPLSKPTALSLSRTIADNKEPYYRAFSSVEDPLNHAELTFFIYSMLDMIRTAQFGIIERLEDCERRLNELEITMKRISDDNGLRPKEENAVYMLMQYEAFGYLGDAPLDDIAKFLEVKTQMARKYMSSLEKTGIVVKRGKRDPLTFALTAEFKERYGIAAPEWRPPLKR